MIVLSLIIHLVIFQNSEFRIQNNPIVLLSCLWVCMCAEIIHIAHWQKLSSKQQLFLLKSFDGDGFITFIASFLSIGQSSIEIFFSVVWHLHSIEMNPFICRTNKKKLLLLLTTWGKMRFQNARKKNYKWMKCWMCSVFGVRCSLFKT